MVIISKTTMKNYNNKILMENQNTNKKSQILELNNLKNTTFNNKDNRMKVHKKEKQKQ
jgi:hypothetical protein